MNEKKLNLIVSLAAVLYIYVGYKEIQIFINFHNAALRFNSNSIIYHQWSPFHTNFPANWYAIMFHIYLSNSECFECSPEEDITITHYDPSTTN